MNIQLNNTEEYIDRKHTGTLGQVLIRYVNLIAACASIDTMAKNPRAANNWDSHRCNNVLWISAAKGVEMNGASADTKMEG